MEDPKREKILKRFSWHSRRLTWTVEPVDVSVPSRITTTSSSRSCTYASMAFRSSRANHCPALSLAPPPPLAEAQALLDKSKGGDPETVAPGSLCGAWKPSERLPKLGASLSLLLSAPRPSVPSWHACWRVGGSSGGAKSRAMSWAGSLNLTARLGKDCDRKHRSRFILLDSRSLSLEIFDALLACYLPALYRSLRNTLREKREKYKSQPFEKPTTPPHRPRSTVCTRGQQITPPWRLTSIPPMCMMDVRRSTGGLRNPARAKREREEAARSSSAVLPPPLSLSFRMSSDLRRSISTLSSRRFIFSYLEEFRGGGGEGWKEIV